MFFGLNLVFNGVVSFSLVLITSLFLSSHASESSRFGWDYVGIKLHSQNLFGVRLPSCLI